MGDPNLEGEWVVYAVMRYSGNPAYLAGSDPLNGRVPLLSRAVREARPYTHDGAIGALKAASSREFRYVAAWGMTLRANALRAAGPGA